ncbi:MAG: hypothetical protein ACXAD7_14610 [Candidatus Kariarchaeaceae archaeon]
MSEDSQAPKFHVVVCPGCGFYRWLHPEQDSIDQGSDSYKTFSKHLSECKAYHSYLHGQYCTGPYNAHVKLLEIWSREVTSKTDEAAKFSFRY